MDQNQVDRLNGTEGTPAPAEPVVPTPVEQDPATFVATNPYLSYNAPTAQKTAEQTQNQTIPVYPAGGTYDTPKPKRKKKSGWIVFLCIALFLTGILFGWIVTGGPQKLTDAIRDKIDDFPFYGDGLKPEPDEGAEEDDTNSDLDVENPDVDGGSFNPVFGDEENTYSVAEIYANSVNGVVGIATEISMSNVFGQQTAYAVSGTGFIFSEDGYILTNCHVVEDANKITVTLYDGTELDAKLIGADSQNDVAVVKVETDIDLTVLPMGTSADMVVGEEILVIGNPLGELTYTLTRGVVSNLSREIQTSDSAGAINMFQTDAAINSGNSGGPAIDSHGNVVGIVSAKYASADIEGLGFCIPIDDALSIAEELITNGRVTGRAALGITAQAVSGYSGSEYIQGVQISTVSSGSAADKAGLKRGDIITEFEGKKITTMADLTTALRDKKAGDSATLNIYRNREYVRVTLVLDEKDA